ncbi:MAG: glycosyltransferase [Acholeplasmataceae bacterium]
MIYQTHVQIANLVIESLTQEAIELISRSEFIKGSNHPDLDLSYRMMKHQIESTLGVVRDLMVELTTKKMSRYERGFKLGIVSHFLADYLCSYHSNPYYNRKNIGVHVRYEQQLQKQTKHLTMIDTTIFKTMTVDGLIEEMLIFIDTHMRTPEISMVKDFQRAVSIVYRFTRIVLNHVKPPYKKTLEVIEKPTRVAIFTDTYYPQINGVSNTIYHYMKYLDDHHIPYVLVSPKYKDKMIDKEVGYNIIRVKSIPFLFYKEAKVAIPNQRKLFTWLDDFDPTVIHVMTEFSIGIQGLKYGQKRNIPIFSNYSTHFVSYLKYMHLGFLSYPLKQYVKWFHKKANITSCPSRDTQNYLHTLGIEQTSVFGRGIYTDQFSPVKRDESFRQQFGSQPFIYLYVGRVSGEKSLDIALKAFQDIKFKHPRTEFLVVGNGPKYDTWKQKFPNVHFLGYKTGEELSKIYASSDVFVFPSATETLGNVVLEAMASGLPVIVANQGGVLENVKNLHNGMIAELQTPASYQKHMLMYYEDLNHYIQMRNNGLDHAKSKHWHVIFNRLLALYQLEY